MELKLSKLQKRIMLFLVGCMGARLFLVYLAYKLPIFWLKIMGIFGILISIGFFSIFWFGLRKNNGIMGDNKIWWNSLRPFHALTYLIFGILALMSIQKYAWIVLLIDVLVGLLAFTIHYTTNLI
jgi:hypothetical protein